MLHLAFLSFLSFLPFFLLFFDYLLYVCPTSISSLGKCIYNHDNAERESTSSVTVTDRLRFMKVPGVSPPLSFRDGSVQDGIYFNR